MKNLYQNIYDSQRELFLSNRTKSLDFRTKQLIKLWEILKENENEICEAVYKDFKKTKFDVISSEIALLYKDISISLQNIKKWSKIKRVKTNLVNFPAKSYIVPEPLGVSLIIGAWNYPVLLTIAPAIAALSAGCTVIIKPSEITENTSKIIASLLNSNFNEEVLHVIEGGSKEVTDLLKLKWDKIFFTGGAEVGKIIYKAAAENLVPVTLELGGKSPVIIDKTANLEIAANRIVWGKFLNAGQTCIAPDYAYVHQSIFSNFLEKLKKRIEKMNYSEEMTHYVQIINEKHYQRLLNLIPKEKIYFQGTGNAEERIFPPTLLTEISHKDKIMQEEIFGPILPIISYTNINEVIQQIKVAPQPLACYLFTSDKKIKSQILEEVSFGGGAINDTLMHITNPHLPFGGVGNSGIGSYHGEEGFKTFSHYKSILDKPTWFDPNLKYPPYSNKKLKLIRKIFGN